MLTFWEKVNRLHDSVSLCSCSRWIMCAALCLQEVAVRNVPLFLRYLTDQMHERVSGSLVLWYDSVLDNGELKWQNELNQSNR